MTKIKAQKKPQYRKPLKREDAYEYPTSITFHSTGEVALFVRYAPPSTHHTYGKYYYRYVNCHENSPKQGMETFFKKSELETLSLKDYCTFSYEQKSDREY